MVLPVFDWDEVADEIGIRVPRSFQEYVSTFPAGEFQTFLSIEQPRSAGDAGGYSRRVQHLLGSLRVIAHGGTGFPHDIFPGRPGLFPWGSVGFDYILCWHMDDREVDSPPIVLVDASDGRAFDLAGDIAKCIIDVATGAIPELNYISEAHPMPRFDPLRLGGMTSPSGRPPLDVMGLDPEGLLVVPGDKVDAVDELLDVVGNRYTAVAIAWGSLDDRLAHPLPRDYRRLMGTIGPGVYGDVTVAAPISLPDIPELTDEAYYAADVSRERSNRTGPVVWGKAPRGWYLAWLPGSYPADQRPVIVFSPDKGYVGGMGMSMTSFLVSHVRDTTNWEFASWRVGEPE